MKGKIFGTTGANNLEYLGSAPCQRDLSLTESKAHLCPLRKSGITARVMGKKEGSEQSKGSNYLFAEDRC